MRGLDLSRIRLCRLTYIRGGVAMGEAQHLTLALSVTAPGVTLETLLLTPSTNERVGVKVKQALETGQNS